MHTEQNHRLMISGEGVHHLVLNMDNDVNAVEDLTGKKH
jgi:hypothetical protein